MNASQIANRTNLLRGTVKYRLRKLGYDTGTDVRYEATVIKEILEFSFPPEPKRKVNHFMEGEIFFYWKQTKNNSIKEVANAMNVTETKVFQVLRRIEKNKAVHFESRMNYLTDNQL